MTTKKLNIGCGRNLLPAAEGWINLDMSPDVGADVVFNLETYRFASDLPFPPNTFDEMLLSHVIEHIREPLPVMEALWTMAKPGCILTIRCPYGSSDIAFEDPTHVRQYFLNSFMYFGQPAYARADYGYRGDWEELTRTLVLPKGITQSMLPENPDELMQIVMTQRNVIDEFVVELSAVKPARPVTDLPRSVEVRFALRKEIPHG